MPITHVTRGVKCAGWVEIGNITMDWIEIGMVLDPPKFTLGSNGLKNELGLDPPNYNIWT